MKPPSSDFHEFSVKKDPFLSKIADMLISYSKTPFSAIFGTLMRTTYSTKCRYRGHMSGKVKESYCFFKVKEMSGNLEICQGKVEFRKMSGKADLCQGKIKFPGVHVTVCRF